MGFTFIGKNPGTIIELGVYRVSGIAAALTELLGRWVELGVASEECKIWAKTLKDNFEKLRMIKGVSRGSNIPYDFLVVRGGNLQRMFTGEHYRHDIIDFEPTWKLAKELDPEWKEVITEFVEFLDSSGGVIEFG